MQYGHGPKDKHLSEDSAVSKQRQLILDLGPVPLYNLIGYLA